MRILSSTVLTISGALLLLTMGCRSGTQTRYLHKNADLGAITKVAVLPFENLTAERTASDKVQKVVYLELLSMQVFDVSEPGEVTRVMRTAGAVDALGPKEYQQIGNDLGVDAVFCGSVVDFEETRSGQTSSPDITIQLRLVDTHSGVTIWSTGQTRSGVPVSTRLFGVGGESLTEAARDVVRAELRTLLK